MLRDSALIGFPLNFPVAFLYGFWSSKKTIILMAVLTVAALIGFVAIGDKVVGPYERPAGAADRADLGDQPSDGRGASRTPPRCTRRESGRGARASPPGATKFGGVLILAIVVAKIANPSIAKTALYGAIPLALAIIAMLAFGVETRRKPLETITAEEVGLTSTRA